MRVDSNQKEIVKALRKLGVSITSLSKVGGGCPDLIAGVAGKNVLLEIKNKYGFNRLTDQQKRWHEQWSGQVAVVTDIDEAIEAIRRAR